MGKKSIKPYSPLEEIRGAIYHQIQIPFNGVPIMCRLKVLNQAEILSIGNIGIFAHLETGQKKEKEQEISWEQKVETLELQKKIAKLCMVNPSYDEFIKEIYGESNFIEKKKKVLEEIKKDLEEAPEKRMPTADRNRLRREINKLELEINFLLPTDTAVFLIQWGLGLDVTPIKTITEDTLLECAALAKRSGNAPHDYISGPFADYQRNHIDKEAWRIYDKHLERQEKVRQALKRKR
jgi:hypothetical protein